MLIDRHTLKILAVPTNGDPARFALNGLHVRDGVVEATDGHILARVSLPTIPPDEAPASWQPLAGDQLTGAILDRAALVKVGKALPKEGRERAPILRHAAIGKVDERAAEAVTGLPGEQTRLSVPLIDATFPNTKAVQPKGKITFSIGLSGRLLGVLADLADRDGGVCVTFHFRGTAPTQAVEFEVEDRDRPITGIVMPIRLPEHHKKAEERVSDRRARP